MRFLLSFVTLCLCTCIAQAAIINVEFKFTPYVGDPTGDQVEAIAGVAKVFLNNVLLAEQTVRTEKLPVLFEGREIAPSVWIPVAALGPALRKGKNAIRIEFQPEDSGAPYRTQWRWASVTDEPAEQNPSGTLTNQTGEGGEIKSVTGKAIMMREFDAPFARDLPWHRYAPVTSLNDTDKAAMAALLSARAKAFKPNFEEFYAVLRTDPQFKVDAIIKAECLDKVYDAGIRVISAPPEQIETAMSGGPEVQIYNKEGELFAPEDASKLSNVTDEDVQICAGMALRAVYPQRLVVVRDPRGVWSIAY